jgi:hypothetical protein
VTGIADIKNLVSSHTATPADQIAADTDIFGPEGLHGDDCDAMLADFAKRFDVDMSGYLWYFHHAEEASFNPGGLLFKPPNTRVARIPVTPELLLEAAAQHRWPVSYPSHSLPRHRYDMWLNWGFIAVCALVLFVV